MLFFYSLDNEKRTYPRLWDMIAVQLPGLEVRKPNVWQAFQRHCTSEASARRALKFGNEPFLVVDQDLWGALDSDSGDMNPAVGQYRGIRNERYRHRIYLAKALARGFERIDSSPLRLVVEAALLHETVHWVRHRVCAVNLIEDKFGEQGTAFEEEAYGRHISLDAFRLVQFRERH